MKVWIGVTLLVVSAIVASIMMNANKEADIQASNLPARNEMASESRRAAKRTEKQEASHTPDHAGLPEIGKDVRNLQATQETQEAFLAVRHRLHAERMKMHSQMSNATPEERLQAEQKWQEENTEALAAQQRLAQQLAAQSPRPELRVPPAPRIPDNATPEMRELLTTRHAVMKEQAEMMNQIRDASHEEQQQAMGKWHQENAHLLEAMHTAATNLSKSQSPSLNP